MTSSRQSGSANFNQRGIGVRFEHGFMNSSAGLTHYLNSLSQMANTIEETNKFLILHKIVAGSDQILLNDLCANKYEGKSLKEAMQDELDNWDAIKKDPDAMFRFDVEIDEKQKSMGADVSDTWVSTVVPMHHIYKHFF